MIKKILHIDNQISKNNNYLNNENYYTFIKVYEIQIFKIFEYLILNEKKITIFHRFLEDRPAATTLGNSTAENTVMILAY